MVKLRNTPADDAVRERVELAMGNDLSERIERLERLIEGRKEAAGMVKDAFEEAKAAGYSVAAVKAVIRRRAMIKEQVAAQAEIAAQVELYLENVGMRG